MGKQKKRTHILKLFQRGMKRPMTLPTTFLFKAREEKGLLKNKNETGKDRGMWYVFF